MKTIENHIKNIENVKKLKKNNGFGCFSNFGVPHLMKNAVKLPSRGTDPGMWDPGIWASGAVSIPDPGMALDIAIRGCKHPGSKHLGM